MSETNFIRQPDYDGFADQIFGQYGSHKSKEYDFTREEAMEMLEQAAVDQAQVTGGAIIEITQHE